MANAEITLEIESADGAPISHSVTPRPWDQFGYVKWAGPALGVDSIQADPMAFGLYGAIRALRREGRLDADESLISQMQRVLSMDYADDEDDDQGAAVDPTMPAP